MKAKLVFLLAILSFSFSSAMAQSSRISGSVSDNMGPIMMANVVERDANNRIVSAATTDMNGNFSMVVKNTANHLSVSYVGCKSWNKVIGAQHVFNIKLEGINNSLKEVTVTSHRVSSGGLNIPKREMSVAQQTMDMQKVEGIAFTSADEALQGQIAGLDIVANSGNLGSGTTMRLRGVTTINGNAEPLIVVDDKIFDNPDQSFDFSNATNESYASLLSVNVEDIASITVLKDAAATAIWGANGANGVIQITTKRGSRGKPRINYSFKFTGSWQPKGYTLLNGDDYTMLMKEEFYNPSQSSSATTSVYELNYNPSWSEYENWNNNTDWVKAVQQFGTSQSHVLSISGGGKKANFRIAASYDHQTGTIIKQTLDRFSTRLALDFFVSDRIKFSTDFALTYTDNNKNYSSLLGIAQQLAPNMSIYRQDKYGNDTGEYYIMNKAGDSSKGQTPATGNYSSDKLSAIYELGNPVAIANLAWAKERTYRITPDFTLDYDLLGREEGQSRLTYSGRVDFDIYANSAPTYYPAELSTNSWTSLDDYNVSTSVESNRLQFTFTNDLTFTPHFKNEDWTATMKARYQMTTSKSNGQKLVKSELPTGIQSTTAIGAQRTMTSSSSESKSQDWFYTGHISYKSRYSLGLSIRSDGSSKFGPQNKWALFPAWSARWNVSDESFMKWSKSVVSMMALRASWGTNGTAPGSESLFYSVYDTSDGSYGTNNYMTTAGSIDGLKLDDLRWEKTKSYNLGFNLGFLNDKFEIEFEYYHKNTSDLLMKNVKIPTTSGYSTLAYANVGGMMNKGWELNLSGNNIIKKGKFSFSADLNVAQNYNEITDMDSRVLESLNAYWTATTRGGGSYLNRIQVGNPLGSIYGFRYKGVYQYTYDYLQNYAKQNNLTAKEYEAWINDVFLASGKTAPIAINSNGKVMMTSSGEPKQLVYNYTSGSSTYTFQGGDAIYEDINHDGQINSLDIVYLGNSMPKVSGGLNLNFRYGQWSLRASFNYRFGNKVINVAKMNLEKMYDTYNQSATVNWRWRKDGDVTSIPRAMYGTGYNWQGSSRYVEDGGFVRFNYLSLNYNVPKKTLKSIGLTTLQIYANANNLYCWTKYSGTDPEHSAGSWGMAKDESQTPRSKSFTVGVNVGF
jgi:TonB-linked SusC/RagA family outer membrane protein